MDIEIAKTVLKPDSDKRLGNIIKTRDDRDLVVFNQSGNLVEGCVCPWIKDQGENDKVIKLPEDNTILRERIEPWLTALFQSEHLNLLCGSGLTNAISLKAGANGGANMGKCEFSVFKKEIESSAKSKAKKAGRDEGNIEDQIRTAIELLRGLEIQDSPKAQNLQQDLNSIIETFSKSILQTEKDIATADRVKRDEAFDILINFLLSFASRTGNRERLNIFTTNYDRLIELGAELAGIHLMDRFVGSLMPIFRSSRLNLDIHYNPPGIRGEPRYLEGVVKMTKLHGSVDWLNSNDEIRRIGLPFGAESITPFLQAPGLHELDYLKLMIYPNPDKDRETAEYPYVELFRDLAAAICRPNNTLVTYGYGFGDEHINRVIKDMLTIPSTHLVIISYNDPIGRILDFYDKVGRKAQITVLIGPRFGDITSLTNDFLPKSAIDRNTFRLGELLQKRIGTSTNKNITENE